MIHKRPPIMPTQIFPTLFFWTIYEYDFGMWNPRGIDFYAICTWIEFSILVTSYLVSCSDLALILG